MASKVVGGLGRKKIDRGRWYSFARAQTPLLAVSAPRCRALSVTDTRMIPESQAGTQRAWRKPRSLRETLGLANLEVGGTNETADYAEQRLPRVALTSARSGQTGS